MASDVAVNAACLHEYQILKDDATHKYVIFTLNKDSTEIVVEKVSSSTDYDDFLMDLPETECRLAVYNFEWQEERSRKRKLTFISWAPDTATTKQQMLFASSKDALRPSLLGISVDIQGSDYSEVAYESVLDKASRGK
jgi:cofilin